MLPLMTSARLSFEAEPSRYRHWRLEVDPPIATLTMAVDPSGGLRDDYELKLNSYDLAVDIELHDALQRLRFEHPTVKAIVITGALDKLFCAGANIQMLATATHAHKVGFCKFTNETRNGIEEMSAEGGQVVIAAVNGTAAGGGYELALACDEILLVDDRSSAVSLPEVPLLAVLPGTGGLTRWSTSATCAATSPTCSSTKVEGIKGKQAVEWGLVDAIAPPIGVRRARAHAERSPGPRESDRPDDAEGVELRPARRHRFVVASSEATTSRRSRSGRSVSLEESLEACRELDDTILDLRFNDPDLGTWVLRTEGAASDVLASGRGDSSGDDWLRTRGPLVLETDAQAPRQSARTLIALVTPGSCFAGTLAELALAADRTLMLDDDETVVAAHRRERRLVPDGQRPLAARDPVLGSTTTPSPTSARCSARQLTADEAFDAGLVTSAPDDLDWDDEVRILLEERASFSPDALTGMEANLRFPGPETMETKIFARLTAWQNWIFQRPNAVGPEGALQRYGTGASSDIRPESAWDDDRRPRHEDPEQRRLVRRPSAATRSRGLAAEVHRVVAISRPGRAPGDDVFLRTAISVDQEGWANFDYVRMPDYRWGIFLADAEPDRRIAFGDRKGEPVWHDVPGEHRGELRRLLVVQGDTEPASVEQQRHLCRTAPSLYDMRNLFQVNVEEGRHLWAMVYLLHRYFGRDGRDEADELLERHSGDPDNPRILGAFNEPTPDWLSFYFFTYFTDRDGKFQLASLRESAFDPLSRTCDFMLKEEAHHMFVGATGVGRVVQRTAELMKQHDTDDIRPYGGIDAATLQRYLNFHFSVSLDLFGAETSTNAANYFASGLKGRFQEERRDDDHRLHESVRDVPSIENGAISEREVAALSALNSTLQDDYIGGLCEGHRAVEPHAGRGRRRDAPAAPRIQPSGRRVPRLQREPRRRIVTDAEWAANACDVAADAGRRVVRAIADATRDRDRGRWRAGSHRRQSASTASRSISSTSGSPDQTKWGMTSSMNSLMLLVASSNVMSPVGSCSTR